MHVLQLTPRYFPNIGGLEVVIKKISETLVANGFQVTVYTTDLDDGLSKRQNINGVVVKRFHSLLGDPFYVPEPNYILSLRKEKARIIHVHNLHTFFPFLAAVFRKKDQKLLLQPHYHRFGQSPFRHSLLRLYRFGLGQIVFPFTDVIVANSIYEKEILREDFSARETVFLIPEGIDVDEVRCVKRKAMEPKRILYIGALKGYKNVDKVLEGFAYLIKSGNRGFRLVIVGKGPERDSLVDLARNLKIASFVEWKSDISRWQILDEYAKASVFVLLSSLESFSIVVHEALLIGVPTVVLNFGATKRLVADGFAEGVDSLEPREIADAFLRALEKTYPKIQEGTTAFLNWEEYSSRIINMYDVLMN